jgi:hypothetical protein
MSKNQMFNASQVELERTLAAGIQLTCQAYWPDRKSQRTSQNRASSFYKKSTVLVKFNKNLVKLVSTPTPSSIMEDLLGVLSTVPIPLSLTKESCSRVSKNSA